MKKRLLLYILLFFPLFLFAQKKQIAAARDQIKTGKDLASAEQSMRALLKDSANRENTKIWLILCQSLERQYAKANEKIYLKQKSDTAEFFSVTKRLYETMAAFDSIDAKPDATGKVNPKYRERHSEYLASIRPNLFNGGVYQIHRNDYAAAYDYFDTYIRSDREPLFAAFNFEKDDALMPHAAYWSMYCGYKMENAEKILKYMNLAERDSSMLNFVRQYEAEAFLLSKDTVRYVRALQKGFEEYPNFAFFFPRLVEYYSRNRMYDSALVVCNKALEADSTSVLFRLTKSTVLLNLARYDECIELCSKLLEQNPENADAHFNMGLAYFDQAIELEKSQHRRAKRGRISQFYEKALPYLEKYRSLAPQEKDKWFAPLYTIYLNLNMGKEFDAIDKLRNANG